MDPRVQRLHCITPLDNLASILKLGILSHRLAEAVQHRSIADDDVQARRAMVTVPKGRRLHDYANLYFNPRNAMMFKRRELAPETCVLAVSLDVLRRPGVVLADCNASCDGVRFVSPNQWRELAFDDIFARNWTHPGNPSRYAQHKARVCAEVLVPDKVPPQYISGAIVVSRDVRDRVARLAPDLTIEVNSDVFFR